MSEIIPFRRNTTAPTENVLRFLDSLGHRQDAEAYLKIFTSQKPESFAIVVLDDEVTREELNPVIFDLRYLVKMGLFPFVIVQASPDTLSAVDVEGYFDKARMPVRFLWSDTKPQDLPEIVENRVKKNSLAMMHVEADRNVFSEVGKVARILKSRKIIFLRKSGPLLNRKTDDRIQQVNLRFDRQKFLGTGILSSDDENFLRLSDRLIEECTHPVHVIALSPNNFLRELFTVKGNGTLIQPGAEIKRFGNWDEVNQNGLKVLLQTSFERKVKDTLFKNQISNFYIEEFYRGAALVQKVGDLSYLSHFAVGTEARGFGVGHDLWQTVITDHKQIFWRSHPDRFINRWYTKQCDGLHKTADWVIFWKGVAPAQINTVIEFALKQPDDLE